MDRILLQAAPSAAFYRGLGVGLLLAGLLWSALVVLVTLVLEEAL